MSWKKLRRIHKVKSRAASVKRDLLAEVEEAKKNGTWKEWRTPNPRSLRCEVTGLRAGWYQDPDNPGEFVQVRVSPIKARAINNGDLTWVAGFIGIFEDAIKDLPHPSMFVCGPKQVPKARSKRVRSLPRLKRGR